LTVQIHLLVLLLVLVPVIKLCLEPHNSETFVISILESVVGISIGTIDLT
jgi:hypothetical protein